MQNPRCSPHERLAHRVGSHGEDIATSDQLTEFRVEIPEVEIKDGGALATCIGLSVVILATFLGIANVKDENIVQQMQLKHADRNDNWAWYQARNIRSTVYEAFAEELSIPWPNETPEVTKQREEKSA